MNQININKTSIFSDKFKTHLSICSPAHLLTCLILSISFPAFAYEDCIITTNGKLTDIKIQHNDIVDIYPLVTVSNNKNILLIHPLKTGNTKFSVLKNNKEKSIFTVNVAENKTEVSDVTGYEVLSIDNPPNNDEYDFNIDEPPVFKSHTASYDETVNSIMVNPSLMNKINEATQYHNMIDSLNEPPKLRGERSGIDD